ncbi:T9SS type A sorting domain-containing protein [Runella sp. SP2]|uniref:T9SS type A sorting domain-containing protein n=1 Tax=Runella sp. SP2 TaxID=2268026 RepID=UPI0013DE2FD1|nr:T9SS type A sorting domain-containing protein [Runella sp. SP2]
MQKLLLSIAFIVGVLWQSLAQTIPSFPGAEGFGAVATGGRGGSVYYVTNLNCSGPGSLQNGLNQTGAKYILFKVSGVIPCAAEVFKGDVTIAGQTSPGGIIVRGIILDEIYEQNTHSRNVIIRHLRSRPKPTQTLPNQGYVLDDGLRLDGASNVIVDHCSFANAIDESVQISHSRNITIQNCMLSETLGEHFHLGGMLVNYSRADHPQDNISIHHNVWNRIGGRFPELSCESPFCSSAPLNIEITSNLFWDQQIQTWYNACTSGGSDCTNFRLNLNFTNNYSVVRSTYNGPLASADFLSNASNRLFVSGNRLNRYAQYSDYQLFYCCNDFNTNAPNTSLGTAQRLTTRHSFPLITLTAATDLPTYAAKNVGAFPRDPMDRRLLAPIASNTIASQAINGTDYFNDAFLLDTAPPPPVDADNDGMPNDWETANGLNPNVQDHNGTQLSKKFTGVEGYTNLECYLNELSDKLVGQTSVVVIPPSTTITGIELTPSERISASVSPNPAESGIVVKVTGQTGRLWRFELLDALGRVVLQENNIATREKSSALPRLLPNGTYTIRIYLDNQTFSQKVVVLK